MSLSRFAKAAVQKSVADPANRGKVAEGKVREALKKLEAEYVEFTFNRILDAHSAGGKLSAQPGDFQAFGWGRNWLLEVKEVAHDYRLGHNNFPLASVARMRKRQAAGSECLVLLYHSTTKCWRFPRFDLFLHRDGGSWDFRGTPLVDLDSTLKRIFTDARSASKTQ